MENPEQLHIIQKESSASEKRQGFVGAQNDQNGDFEIMGHNTEEIESLESVIKKDADQLNKLKKYFGFESIVDVPSLTQSKDRLSFLKRQNEEYADKSNEQNIEIQTKQAVREKQQEISEEVVKRVQHLYIGLAEKYLPEEDRLRKRIVDYYSGTERLRQELSFVFKDMDEKEIDNKINKVEQLFQSRTLFIEHYQKIFERSDAMKRNKIRGKENPIATDEEYEAGTYKDGLEMQVRDAVFAFMKKGYKSFESGFREKDTNRDQYIGFYNKKVNLMEDVIGYFRDKGFEITVVNDYDRTTINIHPTLEEAIMLEEWKEIWDELAEKIDRADLENFDQIEIGTLHSYFRESQDNLRERIPNNKTEAENLFDEDQQDRESHLDKTNPDLFAKREKARYQKALEMFARYEQNPEAVTAQDVFFVAFLFQHGQKSEDYMKAHTLALEAEKRGVEEAKWLSAATQDRYLVSIGEPQIWGTQFIKTEKGWQYATPLEDDAVSGITDEMRQRKNIPVRNSQIQKVSETY